MPPHERAERAPTDRPDPHSRVRRGPGRALAGGPSGSPRRVLRRARISLAPSPARPGTRRDPQGGGRASRERWRRGQPRRSTLDDPVLGRPGTVAGRGRQGRSARGGDAPCPPAGRAAGRRRGDLRPGRARRRTPGRRRGTPGRRGTRGVRGSQRRAPGDGRPAGRAQASVSGRPLARPFVTRPPVLTPRPSSPPPPPDPPPPPN